MLIEIRCLKGIASECQGISDLHSLKNSVNLIVSKFFKYLFLCSLFHQVQLNTSKQLLVLLERKESTVKLKIKQGEGKDWTSFGLLQFGSLFLVSYIFSRHFTKSSQRALGLNSFATAWYARNMRRRLIMHVKTNRVNYQCLIMT